jgi:hypothetical protein
MTMTKTLTKTKTKTKTKAMTATEFAAGYWDPFVQYYVDLPRLFENPGWKQIDLDEVPGPDETELELQELLDKQNNRAERNRRTPDILTEVSAASPQFQRVLMFSQASHPNTYLLFQAMSPIGAMIVMHYKDKFNRPRPTQLEPELRPLIDVPGHPSYPSGHATQAYLIAQTLSEVIRSHEVGCELFKIADEVAVNREWAGLHYASDSAAGKKLAREVFPYVEHAYRETFAAAAREWL